MNQKPAAASSNANRGKKKNILKTLVSDYLHNMDKADVEQLRENAQHWPKFTLGEVLDHERLNCVLVFIFIDG